VNKLLQLACLLPLWSGAVLAQTGLPAQPSPDSALPPDAVARGLTLLGDAARALAPPRARLLVEPGRLDTRLNLAPCSRADAYLPAGMPAWGRVRLGLRCVEGAVKWNVFLPVNVQVFAPAVVAGSSLPAGARLEASQLRTVEVDWSAAGGALYEEPTPLLGRVLSRAISAGQPVQSAFLQTRLWFAPGDTVRLVAAGPGFAIASEGQALTPGQEGRPARVQTESGRIVTGRPVSERVMEVSL
jgi:flagellar basal body P-ring formation protein FlgA